MSEPEATGSDQRSGNSTGTNVNGGNLIELPWLRCVEGCRISDENEEVVLLSCFHSICSAKCVETFVSKGGTNSKDGKLYCGICELSVDRSDLTRKVVPSEIFPKKLDLNGVKLNCQKCVREPTEQPVVAYCNDCSKCLCMICKQNQLYDPECQSHVLQEDLEHVKRAGFDELQQDELFCKVHNRNIKSFYCIQCTEKLCRECWPDSRHNGHDYCVLQDDLDYLKNKGENAKELHKKCVSAEKELKMKRQELNYEKYAVDKGIEDVFAWLSSELEKRKKQLQENAKSLFKSKCEELAEKSNDVAIAKAKSLTISRVAEIVISERDVVAAVNILEKFRPYLCHFTELDNKIRLLYDDFVEKQHHFHLNCEGGNALPELGTFGKIEYIHSIQDKHTAVPLIPRHLQVDFRRKVVKPANVSLVNSSAVCLLESIPKPCRDPKRMPILTPEVDVPSVSSRVEKRKSERPSAISKNLKVATDDTACPSSTLKRSKRGRPRNPNVSGSVPEPPPEMIVPDIHVCVICYQKSELDKGLISCPDCSRTFHGICHLPVLNLSRLRKKDWKCNYCKTKPEIDDEIASLPPGEVENSMLVPKNGRDYLIACKFLMEIYRIPDIGTIKWSKELYMASVGKWKKPFTLDHIWRQLAGRATPFPSVFNFIMAFRHMFIQAFNTYKRPTEFGETALDSARKCFEDFRNLIEEYYPDYCDKFDDVHRLTDNYVYEVLCSLTC